MSVVSSVGTWTFDLRTKRMMKLTRVGSFDTTGMGEGAATSCSEYWGMVGTVGDGGRALEAGGSLIVMARAVWWAIYDIMSMQTGLHMRSTR